MSRHHRLLRLVGPRFAAVLAVALALAPGAGCKKRAARTTGAHRDAAAARGKQPAPALAFMEDDYQAARDRARREGKALFVDAWAHWCHTCLSMQHYVLSQPALAPLAERAVFVAIDTEKPGAAPFLARFPVEAYPTFFVIDPEAEAVVGRWLGSATVDQMKTFVEASAALAAGDVALDGSDGGMSSDPAAELARGMRLATGKDFAGAVAAYRHALELAPRAWPRRTEVLISLIQALFKAGDHPGCVDLALKEGVALGISSLAADFTSYALECADGLPDDDARKAQVRSEAATRLARLTSDPRAPLSADDRGDAFAILAEARTALGDATGARRAHEARVELLELAASQAPDAEAASTYNNALADSYIELGRGEQAVAMLEKSEAALPGHYDPPARLARVYFKLGRHIEARAAIDRTLALAYGPRRLGYLKLKGEILTAMGEQAAALAVLREEVAGYAALPAGQKRPTGEAAAQKRLADAEAAAQGGGKGKAGGAGGGDKGKPVQK